MAHSLITRSQALAFRQHASHLHRRLPRSRLVEAAFAGLQDSSPRSAILSLHARVDHVSPSDWEDPQLVQIWGPRGADYVVPKRDVGVFTLGRMPRDEAHRTAIGSAMERVASGLRKRRPHSERSYSGASRQTIRDLRVASITGQLRIKWDGSRISWWAVEPPLDKPEEARLELARRFLRALGPSTPAGFARWSGGTLTDAKFTFRSLTSELHQVEVESKPSWILRADRSSLEEASPALTVRLLPQGDPYLSAADRRLLIPQDYLRNHLWPRSVWPGALFVHGELAGTWRRQQGRVNVWPWRKLSSEIKGAVSREVQTMPIESARKETQWEQRLKGQ